MLENFLRLHIIWYVHIFPFLSKTKEKKIPFKEILYSVQQLKMRKLRIRSNEM